MGIKTETLGFIHQSIYAVWPDLKFKGRYMIELGDQKFNIQVALKLSGERVWAKQYFEQLGFHHYCIDLHGQNGAFPIDLCTRIDDPFWLGKFDILTNFGTSEHAIDQQMCWENIHNLVKVGGVFIHVLPRVGEWPGHSPYVYYKSFLKTLPLLNDYRIVSIDYLTAVHCHAACFIKQNQSPFVWNGIVGIKENSDESNINL